MLKVGQLECKSLNNINIKLALVHVQNRYYFNMSKYVNWPASKATCSVIILERCEKEQQHCLAVFSVCPYRQGETFEIIIMSLKRRENEMFRVLMGKKVKVIGLVRLL